MNSKHCSNLYPLFLDPKFDTLQTQPAVRVNEIRQVLRVNVLVTFMAHMDESKINFEFGMNI